MSVKYVQLITKKRLSAHSLVIEKGIFTYSSTMQRLCIFCKLDFEDEYHFIFKSSLCHEYKKSYIQNTIGIKQVRLNCYNYCQLKVLLN